MRTNRHLKTIRSTHTRTLLYYCGIYTAIVLASIVQARTQRCDCCCIMAAQVGLASLTCTF